VTPSELMRHQGDLADLARVHARLQALMLSELIGLHPSSASALLPAQVLLREIEARWCDVTDHLHATARALEQVPVVAQG
jgi:hypothetical protein